MDWSIIGTIISISISVIALVLSVISLWQSHFAKFKVITSVGLLGLRVFPIRNGKDKWYIPSLDVPITMTNEGARPGKVMGLRICMSFPELPIPNNREIFPLKWDVDYKKYAPISEKRFVWVKEATLVLSTPFTILPKETVSKHLIFESRWIDAVIQEKVICTLEIFTSAAKKWVEIGKWTFHIKPLDWSDLTRGSCFIHSEENLRKVLDEPHVSPPDLHKYTGTKEPIPEDDFQQEPSYLEYTKKKD